MWKMSGATGLSLLFGINFAAFAEFYAAAGKVEITPDPSQSAVWLAGYGAQGRRAQGVRDPLYARAVLISNGERTVGLVSVDLIGVFYSLTQSLRERLRVKDHREYLALAATHNHSGPDTLGLWGPRPGRSGVQARYLELLEKRIAKLLMDLAVRLEEVTLYAGRRQVMPQGLALDSRDPVIFDPELTVLRLRSRQTGKTVAILGNWACHPEVLGRENRELTADYPGAWCRVMEERHGGTAIFFSGAIGGLLTPDRDFSRDGFAEAERIGKKLAQESLEALKQAGPYRGASRVDFRVQELSVPIENSRYLLALPLLARYRPIYRPDGRRFSWFGKYWFWIRHRWLGAVEARRLPRVRSEVAWARVGPAEFLFVPGELFPELAVGGFDGRLRFGYPLLSPLNPNPPDLAQAPGGPYLKSLFRREYRFLIGLANDELGYIVPRYDFKINPDSPTLSPRPPGHHYEETNSIGPSATDLILEAAQNLLRAIP